MKTARVIMAVVGLVCFADHSSYANPIALFPLHELQFVGDGWVLEMRAEGFTGTLDGWWLRSNSGTAFLKNGIRFLNGFVLISQDSLLSPLTIDEDGDSLTFGYGTSVFSDLTFGNVTSPQVASPRPGQSLSEGPFGYYYLDNSPTLGQHNDTTNAMGMIHGVVTDSLGLPISDVRVSCFSWIQPVYTDTAGRFAVRDYAHRCEITLTHPGCTQMNLTVQIWPESTISLNAVMDRLVSVYGQQSSPSRFMLFQNYPNPFNPVTTLSFSIPHPTFVTLMVYDIFGREVATVVDEKKGPGPHEAQWDASGVASGIYFYRLTAGSFVQTRKLVLMR